MIKLLELPFLLVEKRGAVLTISTEIDFFSLWINSGNMRSR